MKLPTPNLWERALAVVAPKMSREVYTSRLAYYQIGQYSGARFEKTSMRTWTPFAGSADSDSLGDLTTLRARSRDLTRNAGIARGALKTSKVNVVGSGLRLKSQIKRDLLGMSQADAEAWEAKVEQLFDVWAESKCADVTRVQNFYEMQGLAFVSSWESGDCFAARRYKEDEGSFLALCLQLLEADRVCTPYQYQANVWFRDGIEIADTDGTPVAVHVLNVHPGEILLDHAFVTPESWVRIPVKGTATGQSLILHLFDRERIGGARGIPALAAVIEDLKQLDRYSEAELMAAVVSAFFTVFIKNENGESQDLIGEPSHHHFGPPIPSGEVALGSGSVVELGAGESIETANPNRPNVNFDKFFLAIVRKIGVSLGIPYEVLIQHFSSSYSASRAALEVAWQFFMDRRMWLARNFCQPVYEWFLYEAVARGLIDAPGFLDDPIRRAAWCGSEWIGPARIVLDPQKEANSEQAWIDMGVKTLEQVTIAQTGGNWKRNQDQRGEERAYRVAKKLEPVDPPATESSTGRPLNGSSAPTQVGKTAPKGKT